MAKKLFNELETVKKHSISDFLFDEEASIPKGRMLTIGALTVVLAFVLGVQDALAGHRSHRSHSSHRSGSYHASHRSHTSHTSGSHFSHSSSRYHSNVATRPVSPSATAPVPSDMLKIPQILPDTISFK